VFNIDVITHVDLTIIVGIVVHHNIFSNSFDVVTSPSSVTFLTFEWGSTENLIFIWTVFSSPFIFTDHDTSVDFTSINSVRSI